MKVEIREKKRVFDGFLKVDEATLTHERFDGGTMGPVRRLNVERGDAVAALLQDQETGKLLLVKQFRYPSYTKGHGWIIETVAGGMEDGADPIQEARREIEEEIGYQVKDLSRIATFFTTPGGSSERIVLFYAQVAAKDKTAKGGGLESEHEDIQLIELTLSQAWDMVQDGRIMDAKTVIAIQWLMLRQAAK